MSSHDHATTRSLWYSLLVICGLLLPACSNSYVLKGRALEGDVTSAMSVPVGDQRLDGTGISDVKINIYRDPESLGEELVTTGYSGPNGELSIPIDVFGAGWMVENWRLEIYREGYDRLNINMRLPKREDERLLIRLAPGKSMPFDEPENLMKQYRDYK